MFGSEYVDKVYLENGSQEKSDQWEGISFKCTGVAGAEENKEHLSYSQAGICRMQPCSPCFSCWKASV